MNPSPCELSYLKEHFYQEGVNAVIMKNTGLLINETWMNLVLSLKYRSHDTLPSLTNTVITS